MLLQRLPVIRQTWLHKRCTIKHLCPLVVRWEWSMNCFGQCTKMFATSSWAVKSPCIFFQFLPALLNWEAAFFSHGTANSYSIPSAQNKMFCRGNSCPGFGLTLSRHHISNKYTFVVFGHRSFRVVCFQFNYLLYLINTNQYIQRPKTE